MFSQLLESIASQSLALMDRSGSWGVLALSFLDRVLLSIVPSEVVLPLAGFLIGRGDFNFWPVIFLVTVGNLIGDLALYLVSARGGRWILEKYGRYIFVSKHDLEHTDQFFARHGASLVILGRLLPIVRTFIAIPAGIARMPLVKFIWYTVIGSLPYNLLLIFIGLKSGENWDKIRPILEQTELIMAGVLVAGAVFYIYRHFRKKKHLTH